MGLVLAILITRPKAGRFIPFCLISTALFLLLAPSLSLGREQASASSACTTQAGLWSQRLVAENCLRPLPTPSKYNTAPSCPVSAQDPLCGPWTVPADSHNRYAADTGACEYWSYEKRPDIVDDFKYNAPSNAHQSGTDDPVDLLVMAHWEGLAIDGTPQVGDLAIWSPQQAESTGGHVAYVEAVQSGGIVTTGINLTKWLGQGYTEFLSNQPWSLQNETAGWQGLTFIHRYDASSAPRGGPQWGTWPSATGGGHRHHHSRPEESSHLHVVKVHRVGRRVTSISTIRKMERRPWGRRSLFQAKVMFWSRSGTERMRLPVAAK